MLWRMQSGLVLVHVLSRNRELVAMFKLTKKEQYIVAFLIAALVVGTGVREWRARQISSIQPAGALVSQEDESS